MTFYVCWSLNLVPWKIEIPGPFKEKQILLIKVWRTSEKRETYLGTNVEVKDGSQ